MRCKILSISDSDKHFASACAEYEKRMGKLVGISSVAPVRHGTQDQIIEKETEVIRKLLDKEKNAFRILLSKEGVSKTTEQFAEVLHAHPEVVFVIGWPYGLDESQLGAVVDMRISLWNHTMPHGLAKLVLLEQIYRVSMIDQGRTYHY